MLNEKELLVLENLRQDSRKTIARISKETKIPIATVFHKIKSLENKIIKKHVALVDFSKLGYHLRANFLVKSINKQNTLDFLNNNKNVNTIFKCGHDIDFFVDCVFKNFDEMYKFIDLLKEKDTEDIQVIHILDHVLKENFKIK